MAHRYRMYPTPSQAREMVTHCAHARFVWNLALEQTNCWRRGLGPTPTYVAQSRQLTEARSSSWLGEGSAIIQHQALRDFNQAMRNWWGGSHRRPTWRKRGHHEGFGIRGLTVAHVSQRWATVHVPKVGPVRFRLSRALPDELKSARITLDSAGRWHVSFTAIPPEVVGPADGSVVGVDCGVAIPFQCSDGRAFDVPGLRPTEQTRLLRLQRRMARQVKGSNRRGRTRIQIARLKAREADRRKDAIEKVTTELARSVDIVRIEDLRIPQMTRSARGTIDAPGVNVAAKAGLNRAILSRGWGLFDKRLGHKIGDRLERVPAAFTSQRCSCCGTVDRKSRESQASFRCRSCGYTANADLNAALNIAAGHAVTGRGGKPAVRGPDEASTSVLEDAKGVSQ